MRPVHHSLATSDLEGIQVKLSTSSQETNESHSDIRESLFGVFIAHTAPVQLSHTKSMFSDSLLPVLLHFQCLYYNEQHVEFISTPFLLTEQGYFVEGIRVLSNFLFGNT